LIQSVSDVEACIFNGISHTLRVRRCEILCSVELVHTAAEIAASSCDVTMLAGSHLFEFIGICVAVFALLPGAIVEKIPPPAQLGFDSDVTVIDASARQMSSRAYRGVKEFGVRLR
jgi:hypothetical protein